MLYRNLLNRITQIRFAAGQHFKHDYAERIDITPGIRKFSPCLFRCNIMDRSNCFSVSFMKLVLQRCNTKVCNFDRSVTQKHDVMRFNIAMDDSTAVCMSKRTRDLA